MAMSPFRADCRMQVETGPIAVDQLQVHVAKTDCSIREHHVIAATAADPHKWATGDQFNAAVAQARAIVSARADYLRSFVSCEQNGDGADGDGDGARWCDDCDDGDPSVHAGAPEICGNGKDDNCNAGVDEDCL